MNIVCAWCRKIIRITKERGGTSHGVCPECKAAIEAANTVKTCADCRHAGTCAYCAGIPRDRWHQMGCGRWEA